MWEKAVLVQNRCWDIHRGGHCFHEAGLDAYVGTGEETAAFCFVVGPYSIANQASSMLTEAVVQSAMRGLVRQLELATSILTVFGVVGDVTTSPDLTVPVMGEKMPFLPNPSLRASLWDRCSKEERSAVFRREWAIDPAENRAWHRCGIQFHYTRKGQKIYVKGETCNESGAQIARSIPSRILLEVLAEQGFAYMRDFDESRHFEELVYTPAWFVFENCQPSISVA